ncbi:hypothetical protein [Devosia sp. MC1541]|uniref:hypothetical protein n=1 Tax=Devosia sp. MC1541 TaxID=2725264 RepID=UPI00145F1805|nr:hypothetical protein [Devosia sp. MC1541]
MTLDIDTVFRDSKVKNDPHSGEHWPDKPEIRALLKMIQNSGGQAVTRNTVTALNAVTPPNENYMGVVLTGADAGYYSRLDGAWVKGRGFTDTAARLTNVAGTGNAPTASTVPGVDPAQAVMLFFTPRYRNTGAMTLSVNGDAAKPLLTFDGQPMETDFLKADATIPVYDNGTEYRLLWDHRWEVLAAQTRADRDAAIGARGGAEVAQGASETAQDLSEAARDLSEQYAQDAFENATGLLFADQSDATGGVNTTKAMNALRVRQAIDAQSGGVSLINYIGNASPGTAAQVNDALDAVRSRGGSVELPAGKEISVDQTIVITSGASSQNPVRLFGLGSKGSFLGYKPATFKRAPGFSGPMFTAHGRGFEFDGVTIDGDRQNGHGIQITRGFEAAFRRTRIIGVVGFGILGMALSNTLFDHVFIDESGYTKNCADGAMTSGSSQFTSASTTFGPQDIGATITVPGAGVAGADLKTRIASIVSPTVVLLRAQAATTVSEKFCVWDAAALRITGNGDSAEYVSNTTQLHHVHLERNRGIDLDLGWGNDNDCYAEFTQISNLHIEATGLGGTDPTSTKSRPLIRAGNVRGLYSVNAFTYGGSGPHILYEKLRDAGANAVNGITFVGGRMLGHVSNGAITAETPDRLVDLVSGSEAKFTDVQFDTALQEHIRVRSTFGADVSVKGDSHTTRSGATATFLRDDRADTESARKGSRLNGWSSSGDTFLEKAAGAALAVISSLAGQVAQHRFRSGASGRWDLGKTADAETGSNSGSNFVLLRRSDAGANLGAVMTANRSNGIVSFAGMSIPTKLGVPSDADFDTAPPVGTLVYNAANDRIYVRGTGGVWRGVQAT